FQLFVCLSNDPPPTEISTLSLHDALPILLRHAPDTAVEVTISGGADVGVSIDISNPLPEQSAETGVGSGAGLTGIEERVAALDRSEEHTSELQSRFDLVCRLLLEKKNMTN